MRTILSRVVARRITCNMQVKGKGSTPELEDYTGTR